MSADIVCTYCGQAGHRAHACPKRRPEAKGKNAVIHYHGLPITPATAGLRVLVEQRCPLRIARDARDGCCTWDIFLTGYAEAWSRWFDTPPTPHQWQMAKKDWKAGNVGWEAAHNAKRRAKERVRTGAVYGVEAKAMARALLASAAKRDA